MKKFGVLALAATLIITCLVAGCSGEAEAYIDQGETINTSVDKEFVIALDSNPTTGYNWEVSYDDTMLSLEYEEYSSEKCEGLVGAGGTQYFAFKALKAGETRIETIYKRNWEEESIDQRDFTVNIR
jgi:inhibitor of cysteine peptidase